MTKLQQKLSRVFSEDTFNSHQIRLYKFVSKKYLNSFFDTGSIRVGTLHDFRKTEAHGKWRGDTSEGKSNVTQHLLFANRIEEGSFASKFISPGSAGQFKNNTFIEERDFPNSFVFCTSSYFSDDLFRRWNEEEAVDACYEIFDWRGYEAEISKKLAPIVKDMRSSHVTYVKGDVNGESEQRHIDPPFIKQSEYSWQSEFRGVWVHKAPSIDVKAACIEIPDAIRYCRPFAVIDAGSIKRF